MPQEFIIPSLPIQEDPRVAIEDDTLRRIAAGDKFSQRSNISDELRTSIFEIKPEGGTLRLKSGTYKATSAILGVSNLTIIGETADLTVIDFSNTAGNLRFIGSSIYTTGTITGISGGVTVTGSGTAWLANVTTKHQLFIGTRWYKIAAVVSDTSIILSQGYGDSVTFPATYRAVIPVTNITVKNVTLKNSTGTGLVMTDCRFVTLEDIVIQSCNKGMVATNVSEFNADRVLALSSTSNGIEATNVGLSDWESINCISNGNHGLVMNNVKTMTVYPTAANSNTADGINLTTCDDLALYVEATANGGQGIEAVSGSSSGIVIEGLVRSNTSDGIKFTATIDNANIQGCILQSNGGYGVNIAASSCDNNIIIGCHFISNSSGTVNNSGTGTLIRSNIGVADN